MSLTAVRAESPLGASSVTSQGQQTKRHRHACVALSRRRSLKDLQLAWHVDTDVTAATNGVEFSLRSRRSDHRRLRRLHWVPSGTACLLRRDASKHLGVVGAEYDVVHLVRCYRRSLIPDTIKKAVGRGYCILTFP